MKEGDGKREFLGWSRPGRWFLSHNPQRLDGAVISIDCGKRERNRGLGAFGPLGQSVEHGGRWANGRWRSPCDAGGMRVIR
jgi:hypothetical protein